MNGILPLEAKKIVATMETRVWEVLIRASPMSGSFSEGRAVRSAPKIVLVFDVLVICTVKRDFCNNFVKLV